MGGTLSTGGTSSTGGASDTGGTSTTAGTGGSAGGCAGNLLANSGFELADRKGVPADWELLFAPAASGGSFTVVTTPPPHEGESSLLVDTTGVKSAPTDYVMVVASTPAFDVTAASTLHLSAVAEVNDQLAPIWVAVLYFDSGGVMLGEFSAGSANAVDHAAFTPSSSWVPQGPLPSPVRPSAATARVAIVAGPGVSAYVDSICLTW
jgi:hypothetical protein